MGGRSVCAQHADVPETVDGLVGKERKSIRSKLKNLCRGPLFYGI
jgi:hypothetical protein